MSFNNKKNCLKATNSRNQLQFPVLWQILTKLGKGHSIRSYMDHLKRTAYTHTHTHTHTHITFVSNGLSTNPPPTPPSAIIKIAWSSTSTAHAIIVYYRAQGLCFFTFDPTAKDSSTCSLFTCCFRWNTSNNRHAFPNQCTACGRY
jgi:hypothetical protein